MDKRTTWLIFLFSALFFVLNLFFQQQNQQAKEDWLRQKAAWEASHPEKEEKFPSTSFLSSPPPEEISTPLTSPSKEQFFVLENGYQQLVFSNLGGALAEVNLPFQSETHQNSVVREISVDRKMAEQHPYNARFPAHPYSTVSNTGQRVVHDAGKLGGYYPLLRRDLIQMPPRKTLKIPPQYYALNILSETNSPSELLYEVKNMDARSITFQTTQPHRRITKTFSLGNEGEEGPYCVKLTLKVEGDAKNLWLNSGVPEVEWISGSPAPALKYRITRNQKSDVEKIDLPQEALTVSSVHPDWICNSNGFLGMILDPLRKSSDMGYRVKFVPGGVAPSRLLEIDQQYQRYQAEDLPGYQTLLPIKPSASPLEFRLFAGPFESAVLEQLDTQYADPTIGYEPDYLACQTMHGWFTFISEPFAKFLFLLMRFFHFLTHSWGFSIILLTAVLRLILYPLNAWSTKSMTMLQKIAPEVTAIQEKYKKEPKKAQMEIVNLYREKGVNPASGCLPLLIQMPFLIGMFDLLKSSFVLRGAPFIPGWIDDLTAPDVLFSWDRPLFFIGTSFHLLPVLLGGVMFLQQRLMSRMPKDLSLMTEQQRQQRAMGTMMTAVMSVMFYHFPSGLNIYWLSSMLLGMGQQWFDTRQLKLK